MRRRIVTNLGRTRRPLALGALLCAATLVAAPAAVKSQVQASKPRATPAAKPAAAGSEGTFYIGNYGGTITILDEATEKVVGQIPLKNGMPGDLQPSDDRTRFYVTDATGEKIEIVDRLKRETLDTFTLSHDKTKTRIWDLTPDPHDKYVMLTYRNYTKLNDRFDIGPMTLVQYDLAAHKITRTIPWPKNEEQDGAGLIFSPDGKLMYMFGDDILIYETTNFTQVDKWDLSRPLEEGSGRISLGGLDPFSDDPGFYTGLLTMQDPLQNRRIMGIGRIDLMKKSIDFHPVGPARALSFTVTRDHKRAYGLARDVGDYEFWTFDLESYKVINRTPFRGRPRMAIRASSDGKTLYIYQAGNTIDLYDTATFKLLRTITLDGDMTRLLLFPPPGRAAASRN
jgi:DNA-binding beta-propeller fold protein YncE